jgi:glycosyltransferase involved in cell wall biosynthesis
MSSIIHLDITPLAINRTAMFHVVRDTLQMLVNQGFELDCSALGVNIPLNELIENDYCLSDERNQTIMGRLQACVGDRNALPLGQSSWAVDYPPQEGIALVFDPLYLAFVTKRQLNLTYVLDLTPITRPDWHNPAVSALYAHAYTFLYNPLVYSISISHSTTRDLWANLGIPQSRVHTVLLYNRFEGISLKSTHTNNTFLFVGSLEPRKNIGRLAKAFALSELNSQGYRLHIIGQDGHSADTIRAMCEGIPGVHLLGRLDDDDLRREYETCLCLVFPSLWEGFGLPALEALSMGIPLILADSGALPEIGGNFADYVDPCNVLSIAEGLRRAVIHPRTSVDDVGNLDQWLNLFARSRYADQLRIILDDACRQVKSAAA